MLYMCVQVCACKCVEKIKLFFNTFVQFLEEFNEMWRKLLDGIIWELHFLLLDDEMEEPFPQQNMVCITYAARDVYLNPHT